MHANVVTLRYKSPEDVEKGVEKLKTLVDQLPGLPGFQSFTLVRTGDRQTVNVVRFATEENATNARDRMVPKVKELVGPHLEAPPTLENGPVLATK